jgi:hypothetical protein
MLLLPAIAGVFAGLALSVSAIPTISIKGSKFFDSDGNQFFVKGNFRRASCDAFSMALRVYQTHSSPNWSIMANYCAGVAYQLLPDDPLVDVTQCKLDSALMKTLGANSIRVYHVDPDADHSGCMKAFADAGIYLFVDLDTFTTQIEQVLPPWHRRSIELEANMGYRSALTGMNRSFVLLRRLWTSLRSLTILLVS